jgi:hypothetical protein
LNKINIAHGRQWIPGCLVHDSLSSFQYRHGGWSKNVSSVTVTISGCNTINERFYVFHKVSEKLPLN